MARLDERLADAAAALATLEELVNRDELSLAERDGAFFRFVYTFEAIWRAAALLLEEAEGVVIRSTPKDVIRAARRAQLLTDEDAEEAIRMTDDRNQTVHMYKEELGDELAERLPQYTGVLHRWLNALRLRAGPSLTYKFFEQAMSERKQIVCVYDGYRRELCPIILGHTEGEEKALTFQFSGEGKSRLPLGGQWKCFWLSGVSDVELRDGPWHTGPRHSQTQTCVEVVDLDINPNSPYNPKRRLPDTKARRHQQGGKRNTPRRPK